MAVLMMSTGTGVRELHKWAFDKYGHGCSTGMGMGVRYEWQWAFVRVFCENFTMTCTVSRWAYAAKDADNHIFCSRTNVRSTPVALPTPILHQPNLHPYLYNATPISIKIYARRRKLVRPYPYYTRRMFTFLSNVPYTPVLMCCCIFLPQVLLAIGRDPATQALALDKAGVETVGWAAYGHSLWWEMLGGVGATVVGL